LFIAHQIYLSILSRQSHVYSASLLWYCLSGLPWNVHPECRGITHRIAVESPSGMVWNVHPECRGITHRIGGEYTHLFYLEGDYAFLDLNYDHDYVDTVLNILEKIDED